MKKIKEELNVVQRSIEKQKKTQEQECSLERYVNDSFKYNPDGKAETVTWERGKLSGCCLGSRINRY